MASYPIRYWNWKAAALQIAIRCNAYFFMALHLAHRGGHAEGLHAAWIEAIYVCLTAGFYSALQQGAMSLRPLWMSNMVIIAAVPIFSQAIDSLVQYAAGTTHLRAASVGMVLWGLLSSAFHLHLMRNGAMIVGAQSRSFTSDLRRIPWLVATFVAAPVLAIMALLRPAQQAADSEAAA
jgi:hypothetical protein